MSIKIALFVLINCFLLPLSIQAEEKIKIGFLLKTMQEDRYQHDKRFFEERAKSLDVEVIFNSASNDHQFQLKQFSELLVQGCQVIVLQPVDTEKAEEMVREAHARGIKVIGYDSLLRNGPLDVMVMQDSWEVGRQQGKELEKWLKDKYGEVRGKIALIMGEPNDNNAMTMSLGVCETVGKDSTGMCKKIKEKICHDKEQCKVNEDGVGTKNPNLELVFAEEHKGWSADKAADTTEEVLKKYPDIDAFLCNNSGLARGVIKTLRAYDRLDISKIFIAGSEADKANVEYINKGEQNLDICKKIRPLAETAVKIAVELAKNPLKEVNETFLKQFVKSADCPECSFKNVKNDYMDVPTIITPIVPITKENVHTHIDDGCAYISK
ncbi:MAG: hypothetical protein BWK78_04295 [Thiotrichaceae bacterium IS1]|nr:MAG: hypothetical protein BWK78_04295 [Thiotrichaceae bacterium IS1]